MKNTNYRRLSLSIRYLLIIIWLAFTLLPLYAAVVTSLTPSSSLGEQLIYPKYLHFQNYIDVFTTLPMASYFKSTIIYSVVSSLIIVVVASLAAYAVARFNFKGKMSFVISLLIAQILPQIVVVVPAYMTIRNLGLYDTYTGVTLLIVATSVSFAILLLISFFKNIPIEIEEAAIIDGCSRLGVLFRIMIPLAMPGIITVFVLSFFSGWGEYLYPMILAISNDKMSLAVGISRLKENVPPWELMMSGAVLTIIPALLVYLVAQKYVIKGLSSGGIK